jgi:uncharacterized protein YceH (UPF0502 family)
VLKLPRQPGSREARWAHLLCGEVAFDASAAVAGDDAVTTGEFASLKVNLAQLRGEVHELRELVDRLYVELGVSREH